MKKLSVVLVGSINCSGTEKTEKLIKEILAENRLDDKVEFKKVIYTGIENEFPYPIHGSPTILINGKDLIFGDTPLPITLA